MSDDHFSDFDEESTAKPVETPPKKVVSLRRTSGSSGGTENRRYSTEVFSEKISAKYRTFFVDVKENSQGHLIKISEKSRGGRKSTVMLDAEDLDAMIDALKKAREACTM